jgi:glutathione synthase/RimK-type ligase-like ATP-grasp enzyme
MKKIALLTSAAWPAGIPDDSALIQAAPKFGMELIPCVWDEPHDWSRFQAALIRSPWDYVQKKELFRKTLVHIAEKCQLINPLPTLQWNFNKRYLLTLAELGLPIPASAMVQRDRTSELARLGNELVIKPVVSASGFETHRVKASELQQFNWDRLPWGEHEFMAQEFLPSILTEGEYSLIFFGENFSHGIRKTPKTGEFRIQAEHGGSIHPWTPSSQEIQIARAIVKALPVASSYVRVDLARHQSGQLMIMELELIEPELFLRFAPEAQELFLQRLQKDVA